MYIFLPQGGCNEQRHRVAKTIMLPYISILFAILGSDNQKQESL